jgi:hypothetical protein
MRASKKTYTKRSKGKGTKKRNYMRKVKSKRKRVRGGTDDPPQLKRKSGTIQLTRRKLGKLRESGNRINGFETQSNEPDDYKRFDIEDFNNDGSQKTKHPGYIHGFNDGKEGIKKEERNYMPMSQPDDDKYIEEYNTGYADGLDYRNAKAEE